MSSMNKAKQLETTSDLTIWKLVERVAEANPNANAIEATNRLPMTYHRLRRQLEYTVRGLNEIGITRNDRVALMLANGPEMAVAFLGLSSGSVCAPINPHFNADEVKFYLSDMKAKALVASQVYDQLAAKVTSELGISKILLSPSQTEAGVYSLGGENRGNVKIQLPQPDDVALILHTSGTTGRPKIVPLTHSNLCQSAINISKSLGLSEDDRCLNVMPLFHIHGLVGSLLSSIAAGSKVICAEGFQVASFRKVLEDLHPTWYSAVPTIHQSVNDEVKRSNGGIKHNLRFIRSCSSALSPRLMRELEENLGVPVVEAYGMTEAAHQIAINPLPPGRRKPNSVGLATGLEIGILGRCEKNNLELLPRNELGEIIIKGPSVTKGYENNPEANMTSFIDGWFRTGDQGYIDDEGYVFITDRIKEIINRGGEKISPREVDNVLLSHPSVVQAVTFPLPDDRLGEEIAAAVVLNKRTGVSEWELQRFVSKRLVDFKVPRKIVFLDDIPKGPTGKIQRKTLAKELNLSPLRYDVEESKHVYQAPRNGLERELADIWSKKLKIDRIGLTDNYFSLGGDSLRAEEILAEVSDRMNLKNIPLVVFLHAPTIEKMAQLLSHELSRTEPILIQMSSEGHKTPIYLIHACEGEVLFLAKLANLVGKDRPVYAFRAPFLNGEAIPEKMVEEYARKYLSELSTKRLKEPYLLVGASIGGLIALEMAHQLGYKNVEVILIDTVNPQSAYTRVLRRPEIGTIVSYWNNLNKIIQRERIAAISYTVRWSVENSARALKLLVYGKRAPPDLSTQMYIAAKKYVPRINNEPILLFLAQERKEYPPNSANMRLKELKSFLKGDLESHVISGKEHLGIFKEPSVSEIADILNEYLEKKNE